MVEETAVVVNGHYPDGISGHLPNGAAYPNGDNPDGINGRLSNGTACSNGHYPDGIDGHLPNEAAYSKREVQPPMPIAIVGMACRLPGGVSDLESFWDFCHKARNAWTEIPMKRLNTAAFHHPNPEKPGCFHLKGAHYLRDSVASFDAPFFNITAEEAISIDPRHRLLLECTYETLENSGTPMGSVIGRDVGVYIGGTMSHYELHCLRDFETAPRLQHMGCADSFLANRISYFFDLRGPSATIDTACSSGLAALHMACQSLRAGEISQAIVGGAHLNLMPEVLASVSSSMLYSAEGKCFPFDERVSGGFGPGEGTSCVLLKPLKDAVEAGDNIRAIIRNTGMNQDGRTLGISLPSSDAQASLIRSTYKSAGLDPADTKYFEAHGTGTTVGDPLEAAAVAATVCTGTCSEDPVIIGSAKSNYGHLEGVSGIVSVIKAALMLEKRVILPNANFMKPNPKINSLGANLKVPTSAIEWSSRGVRRASVNNLGFGGSNAHVILEEAPRYSIKSESLIPSDDNHVQHENGVFCNANNSEAVSQHLYILTANTETATRHQMRALGEYLTKRTGTFIVASMSDLAFTLGQRRSLLPWKIALPARTLDDLVKQLTSLERVPTRATKTPKLGFVFTGQGANWQGMGRELFQTYPVFSSSIAAADRYLLSLGAKWSLTEELFKTAGKSSLQRAEVSQPACTALQVALVQLLKSWGVRPHSVTGHSSGEIAAAFTAGALTFESCLSIAYHRGMVAEKLASRNPKQSGAMLALGTGYKDAAGMMKGLERGQAVVACINSPSSVTASGDVSAIVELQAAAEKKKLFARRLHVDVAYHSPHIDSVAEDYRTAIKNVKPVSSKEVLFFSSLLGRKTSTLALGVSYWVSNLKSPVLFSDSLLGCCSLDPEGVALDNPITHLIEIGPHSALKGPIRDTLGAGPKTKNKIGYSSALVRNENSVSSALSMASDLFMKGCHLETSAVNFPNKALNAKVLSDLPPYPWNHETEFWHESRITQNHRMKTRPRNDILGTLVADSTDIEPRWRNILRLDDIPWLGHHRVRSNVVFPFAGYVSMAAEAASQRAGFRDTTYSKIEFRDISISQPLVILEGLDVETMLTFRPLKENARRSSDVWDEFMIFSWTEDGGWLEHCQGQVAVVSDRRRNDVDGARSANVARSGWEDHILQVETRSTFTIGSQKLYDTVRRIGVDYGPCLTILSNCRAGENHAMASVHVPDTASTMPHQIETPMVIHPAFLDGCTQLVWPLQGAGRIEVKGLYLPTFVKNLCIRVGPTAQESNHFQVFGTTSPISVPSERLMESIIVIDPNEPENPPVITFDGLGVVSLSDVHITRDEKEKSMYSKIQWKPCLDLLGPQEFQDCFRLEKAHTDEIRILKDLERAALYYFEMALQDVKDWHQDWLQNHHKRLLRLMQKQLNSAKRGENPVLDNQWDDASDAERNDFLQMVRSRSVSGEFICRIGENLSKIMLSPSDAIIHTQDDLLEEYRRGSSPLIRNNKQAAMVVDSLAHENPNLRVLEIGAGTGRVTLSILEVLGGVAGRVPRFQDYVLTDKSLEFLEDAQQKLKAWDILVAYRKLSIEEDPISQGFEPETFDLVISEYALHATARMARTLHNVRRLTKPGGKLLLIEKTTTMAQFFPFATIYDWWAGEEGYRADGPYLTEDRWNSLLQEANFSGVDRSLQDYPGEEVHSHSLMLSTASASRSKPDTKDLVVIQSKDSSRLSLDDLRKYLSGVNGHVPSVISFKQIPHVNLTDSHCIFLDELEHPMLADISVENFRAVQNLCSAAGTLWVVQGGQVEPSMPESSMAVGLARCVRSENPAIRLVTLDLDPKTKTSATRTSEIIANIYQAAFASREESEEQCLESEYMERNGAISIARVVQDSDMDQCIRLVTQTPEPQYQNYVGNGPSVTLKIETPGLLDTLYFAEHDSLNVPLKPDEVEIQVKASALNFRDIMVLLGRLPSQTFGIDCAGYITSVGSQVSDLAMGDRVCAMPSAAFSTSLRCPAWCVAKIPDTTTFEGAASLPVICATVYHSLVNIARLCDGETILIHAAAGGVGQTAVMLSQSIGAEVFATVGSAKKKEILMTRYSIPEDHIFFSRDVSFEAGILALTGKRGVDVALNSLSGDALRATWRCLAHFGRFIEIGKADIIANNSLDMAPFLDNRTYAAVDLLALSHEKPSLMKDLLLKSMDLHSKGVFKPVFPITILPYSKAETAFRMMQGGDSAGKIVLQPQLDDRIKVIPRKVAMSTIRPDATYVITGGSGGLAYSFTKWLAEQGARYIVLASRSGKADAKTQDLMEGSLAQGTTILPSKCDVTDKLQVKQLVEEHLSHMPPIRGVIHGANHDQSALFERCTHEEYISVIRPKVHGAWNLHNTLWNHDLDFFVSIASSTGVIGNQGQSAYCATTTFLEAFASYRASLGFAASTIDLGAVTEVGFLAQRGGVDLQKRLKLVMGAEINEAELLAILDAAISGHIGRDSNYHSITGLQCTGHAAQKFWSRDPLFSHMRVKKSTRQKDGPTSKTADALAARDRLAEAESSAMANKIIYDCLAAKFATVLMVDEEDVGPDKPLGAYGTDSLVAVELRNWVGREMDATVILMDFLADNTLNTLTETILRKSRLCEKWRPGKD